MERKQESSSESSKNTIQATKEVMMASSFIKIPDFDRNSDPIRWLKIYEANLNVVGFTDENKLQVVPGYIKSPTHLDWYYNHTFDDWKGFKSKFIERFSKTKVKISNILTSLLGIKKRSNESMRQYVDRFDQLIASYNLQRKVKEDWSELNQTVLKDTFINGIRPLALKMLVKQHLPKDLLEAQNIAIRESDEVNNEDESASEANEESDEGSDNEEEVTIKKKIKKHKDSKNSGNHRNKVEIKTDLVIKKATDEKVNEVEKRVDDITKHLQKLTLLIENNTGAVQKRRSFICYNCQDEGHNAHECQRECKICKGKHGGHTFWNCPEYKNARNNRESYLVFKSSNNKEPIETYAADKRLRSGNSEQEVRESRSGKKVKVHDTVPREIIDKRKNIRRNRNAVNSPSKTTAIEKKAQAKVKKTPISRPVGSINAEDILKAKVFNVSLEQILPLKGLRSELIQKTKRARNKRPVNPSANVESKELFHISKGKIRLSSEANDELLGAPRVSAIVEGCMEGDGLVDPGSHGSIISQNLAERLNLEILNYDGNISNKLADGSIARPLGEVKNVLVAVQGVLIRINPVVFEDPPYDLLLGSDSIQVLGISADYSRGHFAINTDKGIEPLKVDFKTPVKRMRRIEGAEVMSDAGKGYTSGEDSEDVGEQYEQESNESTDDSSSDESYSESYLIMPVFEEEATKESFLNEVEDRANEIPNIATSKEEIQNIIEQQVQELKLSDEEKETLKSLLLKFSDVFGLDYNDLKQTNLVKFHVDTGDHQPIMRRPNRYMSHGELEKLKEELAKMLANGQIIPTMHIPKKKGKSSLGWSFPAMYVGKKNTKDGRLVIQFQDLNAITKKDPWPLPSLQHLLEDYLGSEMFSTLDLLKGFNQIAVDEDSIPKLTMATPWGCFSYRVLPFGVVNGPACFSRAIYLAMQEYLGSFVSTYIDDITVYSKGFKDHLVHIEKVLLRLREVNMVLKPSKAVWCQREVSVLGFIVNSSGIQPHPSLVKKILDFPKPKNTTDIRAFTSLAGFYRRHVNCFGDIVAPLNDMLKKTATKWGKDQDDSFQRIKEAIADAVQLKYPDPKVPYKLYTDASDVGIGAVLVQFDEKVQADRPICFLSRKLTSAEMKYPTVEKELLGVVYALSKLRRYIVDKPFDLYTDNTAVRYLFTKSDPGSRLQRWVVAVQEFKFKVHHLPGKSNVVADILSRYPPQEVDQADLVSPDEYLFESWLVDPVANEPVYEEYISNIYDVLRGAYLGDWSDEKLKVIGLRYRLNEKGELFRKIGSRFVNIPSIQRRKEVLQEVHDGHGHFGQEATWKRLYGHYWWPKAYEEVKDYVKSCESCQMFAYLPEQLPASGKIPVNNLFERFGVDYIGPFPESRSGKKYIIVAIEYFTSWPIAKAVEKADSDTTVKFLYEDVFCVFGPLTKILSDNGSHFSSKEVADFAKFVNAKHQFAAPYKPSTNGKVEQVNGTITKGIKKMVFDNKKNWDVMLPAMLYAYRTKVHKSLGISPYEALYGTSPRNVDEDPLYRLGMRLGSERLYFLLDKQNSQEDESFIIKKAAVIKRGKIEIGDQVIMKKHFKRDKLDSSYKNKIFTVIDKFHHNTFVLLDKDGVKLKRAINGNHLKNFVQREGVRPKLFKD